jgi:YVTN family beta-propeller protein
MTLIGNQWYLVANGAAKVEIVDTNFKSVGVITDASIAQPRHIVGIDANTAVLSQWGSDGLTGKVLIINLQTKQITKTIATGAGAEQMVVANGKIYVANSGGFGNDSTVSVIDVATQTITKTLNVGDNPNSICVGNDGKIWVLCGGKQDFTNPANDTKGSVWRIDATTATIIDHADMPTNTFHPAKMVRGAGNKPVYFLSGAYGGQVYACSSPVVVEATPVFAGSYLALGTDQIRTSSGTDIYAASGSFTANGKAYRYNTTTQRMVDSFAVGLIPSFFAFK